MKYFAGLDVSLKEISMCVVDDEGGVVFRKSLPFCPLAVRDALQERRLMPARIVHESGQISIWLQRQLEGLGLPAICIDARSAHKVLSAKLNKSDRSDAEGLAQLARIGWFTAVHVRSEDADRLRTIIGARDRFVRLRMELEAHVRGILKTFGIRLTAIGNGRQRQRFRDQISVARQSDPAPAAIIDQVLPSHEALCAAAAALEDEITAIARRHDLSRRLMTIPGIGPVVALNFLALIENTDRFPNTANVGAFLGLTPRRYQSGEVDYSGRISKPGDAAMRRLLYEAASTLINRVKRYSPLKSWAIRLAARRGFKKAAVATARKLAVLMLTLWKTGEEFHGTKEAAT
jgi:transposase